MRGLLLVVLGATACGRVGFDPLPDGGCMVMPSYVQSTSAPLETCAFAPVTTCPATFNQPVRAGSLLRADIVAMGNVQNATIVDSAGNQWALAAKMPRADTGGLVESWYAVNAKPGPTTVTAKFATAQTPKFSIYEDAGIASTQPVVFTATSGSPAAGAATSSLTIGTTTVPMLATAIIDVGPSSGEPTVTATAPGWTLREVVNHGGGAELAAGANTPVAASFTWAPAGAVPWAMIGVVYASACGP